MRQQVRNKQKLYYALPDGDPVPVYLTDENGDPVTQIIDGDVVEMPTGDWEQLYKKPVKFYGNINTGNTGYAVARAYGISSGNFDAVLCMRKGELPIDVTSLIWYEKEPSYRKDGRVDPGSANYAVRRVPPCLDEICYLLRKTDSNSDTE